MTRVVWDAKPKWPLAEMITDEQDEDIKGTTSNSSTAATQRMDLIDSCNMVTSDLSNQRRPQEPLHTV